MAERPMETTVSTALCQQFGAAIDMLENAPLGLPRYALAWTSLGRFLRSLSATRIRSILVYHLSHPLLA